MAESTIAAVGTMNPGKHEACRQCFAAWPQEGGDARAYTVVGVHVESGVADQPMGLEETLKGAKNRAENARASHAGAAIGIGLESGLVLLGGVHLDFCACSIYTGSRHCVGLSSMWALPPSVAVECIRASDGQRTAAVQRRGTFKAAITLASRRRWARTAL